MENFISTIIALLPKGVLLILGGVLWEGFKFFYPDIQQWLKGKQQAKEILTGSLDPTLKAADELFGKLTSLAKEDFATFVNPSNSNSTSPEHNKFYTFYLFAQFWACLEHIRIKSNYSSITSMKKGYELIRFIETFEARKFRILDRSKQRIIGESLLMKTDEQFKVMPMYVFFQKLETEPIFKSWIEELNDVFDNLRQRKRRQRVLVYGVLVAAFINHFDKKHKVVRKRDIYLGKLRPESINLIRRNLLSSYLKFVDKGLLNV